MQARMMIAFALVFAVIFATPYFFRLFAPPAPAKKAVVDFPKKPEAATSSAAPAPVPVTPPPAGSVVGAREESTVIDTDLYHVIFSNRGGVVRSWTLKNYKDGAGKPLELVNPVAIEKVGNPFSYDFREKKPSVDLNKALFVSSSNGLSVSFQYSDGRVFARKVFEFQKDSYLSTVTSEVSEQGAPILSLLQWRGGFGDMAALNAYTQQAAIRYQNADSKVERQAAKAAKEGPLNNDGSFSFAGLEDQYFASVFLPTGNGSIQTTTFDDKVATPFDKEEQAYVGVAVGGTGRSGFSLYVGPKDVDTLRRVNPKLEQIVDFGWFAIIAKPLFLILHFVNDQYIHNYGWSIILITLVINVLLFPLKLHQHEVDEENAGAPAADSDHQRKIQEHPHARPAPAAEKSGDHGSLQEARRQPRRRLSAPPDPDAVPVRVLQSPRRLH